MVVPIEKPPAISCPKGTYAVYSDEDIITLVLIDALNQDTASRIVDSINRVFEQDRTKNWKYCIYLGNETLTTFDAENKFKQFIKFRKWLSTVMQHSCKIALVIQEGDNTIAQNQIKRVFVESSLSFKEFETKNKAISWLQI